jgi:hypothetical protein
MGERDGASPPPSLSAGPKFGRRPCSKGAGTDNLDIVSRSAIPGDGLPQPSYIDPSQQAGYSERDERKALASGPIAAAKRSTS